MEFENGNLQRNDTLRRAGARSNRRVLTIFDAKQAASKLQPRLFVILAWCPVTRLGDLVTEQWRGRLADWERAGRIVLYDEVGPVLCHAVRVWAGVPIVPAQIRIELMKRAVTILTGEIDSDVPDQDLRASVCRMPTLPASRFVLANVKRTTQPVSEGLVDLACHFVGVDATLLQSAIVSRSMAGRTVPTGGDRAPPVCCP